MAKLNPESKDPFGAADGSTDDTTAWAAPVAAGSLKAHLELPGSKSLTNRELILAALADGPGRLNRILSSRDTDLMLRGLKQMGVTVTYTADSNPQAPTLDITPAQELTGSTSINCGLAGTVMRFLPAVAALAVGPVAFDGDAYARKRPMRPVLTALRELGADIADDGRGALPFTVHGTGSLRGGRVELDASLSSQFVSGLLLAAARFDEGVHIVHTGETLPSLPHIEMTLECLRARGVKAYSPQTGKWLVEPGPIAAREVSIEPDLSNAAPFLAAALVCGGEVSIAGWPAHTTQVGDSLRHLLTEFGGEVSLNGDILTVRGSGKINGVRLNIPEAGELAPTLVALAALADSESQITGIGHIRHHETDRIAALVAEINRLGGNATELADGIRIKPTQLNGGLWHAYADHRMATSGALIGLATAGVRVDDIACTAKTMPGFVDLWQQMLTGGVPRGVDPLTIGSDLL